MAKVSLMFSVPVSNGFELIISPTKNNRPRFNLDFMFIMQDNKILSTNTVKDIIRISLIFQIKPERVFLS